MTLRAHDIPFATITRPADGWRVINDVELNHLPDPEFSIVGVLPRRGLVVMYGPSGSCKTTLEASIAVSLASLRPWFGHRVAQAGASLYVGAEDVNGWKVRLGAAKRAAGFEPHTVIGCYTFPDALDLLDSSEIDRLSGSRKTAQNLRA